MARAKNYPDDWTKPENKLPIEYDLVSLKLGERELVGWWDGREWMGRYIKPNDKVDFWKPYNSSH